MSAINTNRKGGIRALSLEDGNHLISVMKTNGNDRIVIATAHGMPFASAKPMSAPWAGKQPVCVELP